jgi:hypothetical protein
MGKQFGTVNSLVANKLTLFRCGDLCADGAVVAFAADRPYRVLVEHNLAVGVRQTVSASFKSPVLLDPLNGGYCPLYQACSLWLILVSVGLTRTDGFGGKGGFTRLFSVVSVTSTLAALYRQGHHACLLKKVGRVG